MTQPTTCTEYLDAIAARLGISRESFGITATEPGAPLPWAVYDPETGDILGAGHSLDAAAMDAWETVSNWRADR